MVKLIKSAKVAQVGFHRAFPLWLFNRQPQDRVLDMKTVAQLNQLHRDVKEHQPVVGGKEVGPTLTLAETGSRLTLTWA